MCTSFPFSLCSRSVLQPHTVCAHRNTYGWDFHSHFYSTPDIRDRRDINVYFFYNRASTKDYFNYRLIWQLFSQFIIYSIKFEKNCEKFSISQSLQWCLWIASFGQPTVQIPQTLHLLSQMSIKQSIKSYIKGKVRVFEVGSYKVPIYSRSVPYHNHWSAHTGRGPVH